MTAGNPRLTTNCRAIIVDEKGWQCEIALSELVELVAGELNIVITADRTRLEVDELTIAGLRARISAYGFVVVDPKQ